MSLLSIVPLGLALSGARRRNSISPDRLAAWRQARLLKAVGFARERSEYYRRRLAGWDGNLGNLPVLTRADYMENWDLICTQKGLRLADARAWLAGRPSAAARLHGRYHVCASSGSTGSPAVFAFTEREWIPVMASALRLSAWRGASAPKRLAFVTLDAGHHMAARMVASAASVAKTAMIDAAAPVDRQVSALNAFQPDTLNGYPSALSILAAEQIAGRLRIAPRVLTTSSEMLSDTTARLLERAFGQRPHNVYAASEFGTGAGSCGAREGVHLNEDFVCFEWLDERGRPVPAGESERIVATPLWAWTLPMIRYELSDRFTPSEAPCPCGLPFRHLAAIDGRNSEVIEVRDVTGAIRKLVPGAVSRALREVPIQAWQIVIRPEHREIRVVPAPGAEATKCQAAAAAAWEELTGAPGSAAVRIVTSVHREKSGKTPLVIREDESGAA